MPKIEQKNQYLAAMHQFAYKLSEVAEMADLLARSYNFNDFGPTGASAITAEEADQNNFTLQEIADMVTTANALQDFWLGKTVTVGEYRKFTLRARMIFTE